MTSLVIIDDHPGFVAAARALLALDGFEVLGEAFDGWSGVALTERLHPEVVLLDIQLPDIDGFRVAVLLAGLARPPAVVLTSSRDGADYGSRLTAAPALGFIAKADLTGARLGALVRDPDALAPS